MLSRTQCRVPLSKSPFVQQLKADLPKASRSISTYGSKLRAAVPGVTGGQEKQTSTTRGPYELVSPLLDDMNALGGRIRRTSINRHRRNKSKALQHPVSYYDLTSTRPPQLNLPGPLTGSQGDGSPSTTDRVKHIYHLAKGYLTFYKDGLKAVWSNYKEYRKISRRARAFDKLHWTTPKNELISRMKTAFDTGQITRREYVLWLRTRGDLKKLIPFGLILAVCGELSPLVLIPLGPRVIPLPCMIPKHVIQHFEADKSIDRITLPEVKRGTERQMPTIPSHTTWKSFHHQLHRIDQNAPQDSEVERQRCIGKNWYRPKHLSAERPLADALLILWEGGVDGLDNQEVLMKTWDFHDLYLNWMWKDAWFASQGRNIEREDFGVDEYSNSWTKAEDLDLYDLRQELQLSLQDLVAHLEYYFRTGMDYDPSKPMGEQKQVKKILQAKK